MRIGTKKKFLKKYVLYGLSCIVSVLSSSPTGAVLPARNRRIGGGGGAKLPLLCCISRNHPGPLFDIHSLSLSLLLLVSLWVTSLLARPLTYIRHVFWCVLILTEYQCLMLNTVYINATFCNRWACQMHARLFYWRKVFENSANPRSWMVWKKEKKNPDFPTSERASEYERTQHEIMENRCLLLFFFSTSFGKKRTSFLFLCSLYLMRQKWWKHPFLEILFFV